MEIKKNIESNRPVSITAKPTANEFVAALNAGSDNWQKAGEILVALRREDDNAFHKIVHDYPFVTYDILDVFFQIGIKTLYPLALLLPRHVFSAVRQMRYDAQVKVMSESVEVVTRQVGDKPVVIRKGIAKLSPDEVKRVLGKEGARPVAKQVALLNTLTPTPVARKAETPSVAIRTPKEVARFAVSRGVGGTWRFERTQARSGAEQRVLLQTGQAIVVLTEYEQEKD